jgi:hypothetical protein
MKFVRSKETLADLLRLATDDKSEEQGNKKQISDI